MSNAIDMKCPKCRARVLPEDRYCVECGAAVEPARKRDLAPLAVVACGVLLAAGIYFTAPDRGDDRVSAADPGKSAAKSVSGTLGTTRLDTADFSIRRALTELYGNYDPNLDGAFWKAHGAPPTFASWNGRALFIRPLVSRPFTESGSARHLVVTNSLETKDGEVVKQGTGCRTCRSLIGAAIFEKHPSGWKLISRHDFLTAAGSWGAPPKVSVGFPDSGGIDLEFETATADQGRLEKKSYAITLKARKTDASAVTRTSAR